DLPIGRCHRGVFRRRAAIDVGGNTGALAANFVRRDRCGKHAEGIRLFRWRSGYARRRATRPEFGSGLGSNPRKRGEEIMTKSAHFGSNSSFRLSKAILVYSDGQQLFATMHEPRDSPDGGPPYLDAGEALTIEFLKQLAKGLGRSVPREILPSNVLAR